MRVRWNVVRALFSVVVPIVVSLVLVGWAEEHAHTLVNGVANAPATATTTATTSAYPLPGQPSGPSSAKATATPTRLAAYPLPGLKTTPTPTSGKSGTGPLTAQTGTLTYTLYLPIVRNDCYFKGTAGINAAAQPGDLWYTNTLAMGICAGYEWNHVYTPTHPAYSRPWEVINDVRSTVLGSITAPTPITWYIGINYNCPGAGWKDTTITGQIALRNCVYTVAASRPGMYWLIWNEPDDEGQDNFSPAQGAQFFREISNTILSGDPTAKLIVGNVLNWYHGSDPTHGCPAPNDNNVPQYGCGVHWLTQFISEALALGYDPRPFVAGYGYHVYAYFTYSAPPCSGNIEDTCHDAPLVAAFTNTVMNMANWVAIHDPCKPIWLTEINWYPALPWEGMDTQLRRMSGICSTLATLPIDRYFWWYGDYPWAPVFTTDSLHIDQSGALSPAGQRFALPPDPISGGCPVRR